jgi:hypothetical protein
METIYLKELRSTLDATQLLRLSRLETAKLRALIYHAVDNNDLTGLRRLVNGDRFLDRRDSLKKEAS